MLKLSSLLLLFTALSCTSRKDWVCSCTTKVSSTDPFANTSTSSSLVYPNLTESEVKNACENRSKSASVGSLTTTETCSSTVK